MHISQIERLFRRIQLCATLEPATVLSADLVSLHQRLLSGEAIWYARLLNQGLRGQCIFGGDKMTAVLDSG